MSSIDHAQDQEGTRPGASFGGAFAPLNHRGDAISSAIDGTAGFGARLWRAIVHKVRERATINALSELDDRTLSDIGVPRSEIRHIAGRLAHDPHYDHRVAMY